MRVLHVVRQFAPSVGGLEDVVLNLARVQRRSHGIDARVLTLDRLFTRPGERLPPEDEVEGVPVRRLPWRGSPRYPLASGVLPHVRRADLVQVHAVDFFLDFLALSRPLHRRPLILATHGGIFHTDRQAALKRLWFNTVTRLSLQATDAVVAVSASDAALFRPLRPPRLELIENGADLCKLRTTEPVPRDPFRILVLGRFAPHKRIGLLLPVLSRLRAAGENWTLTVAGVEGGETASGLRAQAVAAGVAEAVRVLTGAPPATLAREAAAASWFASASAFEGFGLAAVEAVAAGLLPVLSRIPPFERLAATLPDAVLFDPADPQAAARAVLDAAARHHGRWPGLRLALSEAADRHDWSHAAARYAALYRQVLGQPRAARPRPEPA